MQTKLLCLTDSYLKECDATVAEVRPDGIVLDQSVFYPAGGGQPGDHGAITNKATGQSLPITDCIKSNGEAIHVVAAGHDFKQGDSVHLAIDWERRHAIMRMHTAAHVLGSAMFRKGYLITGNQLGPGESRIDFSMESFDRELYEKIIADANAALASGMPVSIGEISREEALKTEGMIKLAGALPPAITMLRTVKIGDWDYQADGGTHVANTSECGQIEVTKLENKGAKNKRAYFRLTK